MNNILYLTGLALLLALPAGAANHTFSYNGHTYELVTDRATWGTAKTQAATASLAGQSGYLAVIDSAAENTAIFNWITALSDLATLMPAAAQHQDSGARGVWIGASDSSASISGASEGNFSWIAHGSTAATRFWQGGPSGAAVGGAYSNWGSSSYGGEPDNFFGIQHHVAMQVDDWPLGSAGQWNDLDGTVSQAYLVEYDTAQQSDPGSNTPSQATQPGTTQSSDRYAKAPAMGGAPPSPTAAGAGGCLLAWADRISRPGEAPVRKGLRTTACGGQARPTGR